MHSHPNPSDLPHGAAVGSQRDDAVPTTRSATTSFGSQGTDPTVHRIDLNDALIRHPQATFVVRVEGTAMRASGIDHGDVLLVDRAIAPAHGHIVVAVVDGDLVVRRLLVQDGSTRLAADDGQPDIVPQDGAALEFWGVATKSIKSLL